MIDQAEALRMLVRSRRTGCDGARPRVYTVAVTSGKGGVGKTGVAVNLALLLARNRPVRLVDADFGLSNAEVLFGVSPKQGLAEVLRGQVDARDAWVEAAPGVKLLSSGSGLADMADMDGRTGSLLLEHAIDSAADGDIVIVDTAPGIDETVMSVLKSVDEVIIVTTPEPTSITDTYAAIKVLTSQAPDAQITLVANCCNSPSQASAVAAGLEGICNRFLGRSFQRYEYLPRDPEVARAVQRQTPLVMSAPHAPAASWLRKIAIRLDDRVRKAALKCTTVTAPVQLVGV